MIIFGECRLPKWTPKASHIESKMEVNAPVVKSPAPLAGPTEETTKNIVEVKEAENDDLGLDDGVETF